MVASKNLSFRRGLTWLLALALLSPLAFMATAEENEQSSDLEDLGILEVLVNEDGSIDIVVTQTAFAEFVELVIQDSANELPPISSIEVSIGLNDASNFELDDMIINLADEPQQQVTLSISLSDDLWLLLENGDLSVEDILNMIPPQPVDDAENSNPDESDESSQEQSDGSSDDDIESEDDGFGDEVSEEPTDEDNDMPTREECEEMYRALLQALMEGTEYDESLMDSQMMEDCEFILAGNYPDEYEDYDDFDDDEEWDDEDDWDDWSDENEWDDWDDEDCGNDEFPDDVDPDYPMHDTNSEEWQELQDAWDELISQWEEEISDLQEREDVAYEELAEECSDAWSELMEDYYENYLDILNDEDEQLTDLEEDYLSDLEEINTDYDAEFAELQESMQNVTTEADYEVIRQQMDELIAQESEDIDALADEYEALAEDIIEASDLAFDELNSNLDADSAAIDEECHAAMEALEEEFAEAYAELDESYEEQAAELDARSLELLGEEVYEPVDDEDDEFPEQTPDEQDLEDVNSTSDAADMESMGGFAIGDTVPGFTGFLTVGALAGAVLLAGRRRL